MEPFSARPWVLEEALAVPPTAVHLCVAFALGAGAARHALSSPFLRYRGRARPAPQLRLISWTFRLGLSVSLPRGLRDRWPSLQVAVPVLTLRLWADDSAGVSCVDSVRGTFPASASSRGHARSGPSPRLRRGLPPPASPAPSSPDAARGNRSRPGARPWVPLLGVERAPGAAPNAEVGASGAGASRGAAGARTAATRGGVGAGPQPPHGAP